MKLLLVDDDLFLRDMYAAKFSECDFDIAVAENSEQALVRIAQSPDFEVVLTDMIMPGMGGVELIQEINNTFPDMNPCMIVLSNQGQETDIAQATAAGAAGYIIKAESVPSDVVKKVTELVTKHKS